MATHAELLNEAGTKLSAMNDHLAKALQTADTATAVEIRAALALLGPAGKALGQVADAVLKPAGDAASPGSYRPGLRPGQVVGDVGGGSVEAPYTGTIQPSQLTARDWRIFAQNYEHMRFYTIFASSPAGQEKNSDGSSMHQGDLAQKEDVASYKADGGLLSPWL